MEFNHSAFDSFMERQAAIQTINAEILSLIVTLDHVTAHRKVLQLVWFREHLQNRGMN